MLVLIVADNDVVFEEAAVFLPNLGRTAAIWAGAFVSATPLGKLCKKAIGGHAHATPTRPITALPCLPAASPWTPA
jgi:hypothetical protein